MSTSQPGILASGRQLSRFMEFSVMADRNPLPVLRQLAARPATQELVLGLGPGLVQGLGRSVDGLRPFPNLRVRPESS